MARSLSVADGASRLVAQKLAYLAQQAGAPLQLAFAKAQYGPYAEELNHVLQAMEGHYTVGCGDRTSPSPLAVVPVAVALADDLIHTRPELANAVDRVDELIDGLESPYGLELLATVHYVASFGQPPAMTPAEAADQVRAWSARKEHSSRTVTSLSPGLNSATTGSSVGTGPDEREGPAR